MNADKRRLKLARRDCYIRVVLVCHAILIFFMLLMQSHTLVIFSKIDTIIFILQIIYTSDDSNQKVFLFGF